MAYDKGLHLTVRLRQLYELNKLLVRFENVVGTLPELMTLVTRALPLRSAAVILPQEGRATAWHVPGDDARRVEETLTRAREAFAYLAGPRDPKAHATDPVHVDSHELPEPAAPLPTGVDDTRFLTLPLVVAQDAIFGLFQVEAVSPLDELDLQFVDSVVGQLSIAIGRQWAVEQQRALAEERRQAAERAERAQRFLADMGALLATSLDLRTTLSHVARLAVPELADLCFIDEVDEDGRVQRLEVAHAGPEHAGLARRVRARAPLVLHATAVERLLVDGTPHGREVRLGEDAVRMSAGEEQALLRELGLASMMVIPLLARGRALGALVFLDVAPRPRGQSDLAFAADIGRRASMAIDNARLYRDAQRALATREQLLRIVSHDLRTPLSSILLNAQLLLRSAPPDARHTGRAEAIRHSALHMDHLIKDLLEVASLEAGRLRMEKGRHEAAGLLQGAITLLRPLATERSLRLEAAEVQEGLAVTCDRERVLQVFANLVGNALKFTPAGGTVSLRVEPLDGEVRFSVVDTGPGMPPDVLAHVFEWFWQAAHTARQGTGLGLAISQGIVESLGGRIWVESEVARGTAFHFTLPAAAPADRDPPPRDADLPDSHA